MITQKVININRKLGGVLLNKSSLEFAEEIEKSTRSTYRKSAIWIRAIVIDHPFSDFNKRTALIVFSSFVEVKDQIRVASALIRIAKRGIADLDKIEEVIRNANRPKD